MTIKKSDIIYLSRLVKLVPESKRTKAQEVLDLYKSRKINQFRTADNLILSLRIGDKKEIEKTTKKIETLRDAIPVTGIIERTNQKIAERNNALRLNRVVNKARKVREFNDLTKIKVEVDQKKVAYNGKVFDITIKPVDIGAISATDISTIIAKSYLRAIKEIPFGENFRMFSDIKFDSSRNDHFYSTSKTFIKRERSLWLDDFIEKIMRLVQSDEQVKLNSFRLTFHFAIIPSGSGHLESKTLNEHYKKKSVVRVKNNDNNCFWYSLVNLVYINHEKKKEIKLGRKIQKDLALKLCDMSGKEFDNPVSIEDISDIEDKLDCNIYVFNSETTPIQHITTSITDSLMYFSSYRVNQPDYFLLYSESITEEGVKGHYDSITNIKGFLNVRGFCYHCLSCFTKSDAFEKHKCRDEETKVIFRDRHFKYYKDSSHYLQGDYLKGSQEEIDVKFDNWLSRNTDATAKKIERVRKLITDSVNKQRYIIWDAETDTSTLIHQPNLIVVNVLEADATNNYDRSLVASLKFEGYNCCDEFCNWLFSKENANSIIIAHNGSGYDYKFVLKWCISKSLRPDTYICQGSHITLMRFEKYNLTFKDSLNFFLSPLAALSKTYGIDTVKGFFPHHFNIPENQNYIGPIPSEEQFGVKNMDPEIYEKKITPWYESVRNDQWNFKEEFMKYCVADVVLLAKAVLKFRGLFLNLVQVDPWRYTTLSSLCMAIYRSKFLPDKTIVGHSGSDRNISTVSKEWLIYSTRLDNKVYKQEVPIFIKKDDIDMSVLSENKVEDVDINNAYYFKNSDAVKFSVDGLERKSKTVKEFYGCYWHGCRKCHPNLVDRYNKTMERENILRAGGYKVEAIWECEWNDIKANLNNKQELETMARQLNINVRDALFGGRTEGVKTYHLCKGRQQILTYDVCSLYPTVNALDDYAVGFKRYVIISVDDIFSGRFFGLVKVDIIPPKNLYIPLLPDRVNGKLLFHLNPMFEKTFTSVELKKALELGYKITKIHSAVEYDKFNGLMKAYVEKFVELKIKCSGVLTDEQAQKINQDHLELGLNINIKAEETSDNPGLRQVAKILLNSLWGKFGQRTSMKAYKFLTSFNDFTKHITDKTIVPLSWEVISSNIVEFGYTDDIDNTMEAEFISEITAVFTTANARLRLYDMLSFLHPSQILYYDTDSCYFLYDPDDPNHKKPSNDQARPKSITFAPNKKACLGQWECDLKEGEYITEFVCGGAKSYAYITNKGKPNIRQKGITLDVANSRIITLETFRNMVLNGDRIETDKRFQFKTLKNKDIKTDFVSRGVRPTIGEKRQISEYDTYPFGYECNE